MATSGLDHLKNGYRRRFCRLSRAPDINPEQGRNILEILQNCFEEKSFVNDFSTDSTKSVLYSTPKIENIYIQSSSQKCQKSQPKSISVSSRKKEASLQFIVEPNEAASRSVQGQEVCQKDLTTDGGSENTPGSKRISDTKPKDPQREPDEEFYLSIGSPSALLDSETSVLQNAIPSIAQNKETYTFENSVNTLSSSAEISLKTKKRLNFEDKVILKEVEVESKVEQYNTSERQQERKPAETSQKRIQDPEHEIQAQAKKKFSTLFLETINRKSESSSVVRHLATAAPHLSPPNDIKLIEDEFVIDESDRSFAIKSWITIPRKAGPVKQGTVSSAESTALLQGKASREKHPHVSPKTLASDKASCKAQPLEKSQPSGQERLGTSCMESDSRSIKHEIHSQDTKSSGSKKATKQKQTSKLKANIVEEQFDMERPNDENLNTSHIAQNKFKRNSLKSMEECEKMRNDHTSTKQMPPLESKKSSSRKGKEESKKKRFSTESKNKVVPEEVTLTVTRSRRISRCPSDWWVVKSEQRPVNSNSSIRNELSAHRNNRQKPTKNKNQSSKNIGENTIPFRRKKTATQGSLRMQKSSNSESSEDTGHDKISGCAQSEPLEKDKTNLAKKKDLDNHFGCTGSSKDQDGTMSAHNFHLKTKTSNYTCTTPTDSNLDSEEPNASVLEESGPSRRKNYLMSRQNNSDVNDEKVQESSDDSRLKRFKVTPNHKVHHKLVLPSNTPNVRRTKRIRLKPLEYWRGERIDYQGRPSGGFVIGGILSPDTMSSKRKTKRNMEKVNKIANQKRICLDNDERRELMVGGILSPDTMSSKRTTKRNMEKVNKIANQERVCLDSDERRSRLMVNLDIPLGDPLQPTRVKDPQTREIILMDLVRPRDTCQFFVKHGELEVYKTLDTPFFSTGKLKIGPHQEKGKQHVGSDILIFYVNSGYLLCTLHETSYIITTGDSFYIPSGNYYNIKNLLNEESTLLFTQIKR